MMKGIDKQPSMTVLRAALASCAVSALLVSMTGAAFAYGTTSLSDPATGGQGIDFDISAPGTQTIQPTNATGLDLPSNFYATAPGLYFHDPDGDGYGVFVEIVGTTVETASGGTATTYTQTERYGFRGELSALGGTLPSDLDVDTVTTTGDVTVGGDSTVAGDQTVTGTSNLGDTNVDGTLTVAGDQTVTGTSNLGDTNVDGTLTVARDSLFGGAVNVNGPLSVREGTTSFDVNGDGMNLVAGSSALQVTNNKVAIQTDGGGFASQGGHSVVTGAQSAAITGGGSSMTLTNTGAHFSGSDGQPLRLSGVAPGVAPTDAVNMGQLNAATEKLAGGVAMAMAMSQFPQPSSDQTFTLAAGISSYMGTQAIAIGGTARFDENWTVRGAIAQQGNQSGGTLAIGYSW